MKKIGLDSLYELYKDDSINCKDLFSGKNEKNFIKGLLIQQVKG